MVLKFSKFIDLILYLAECVSPEHAVAHERAFLKTLSGIPWNNYHDFFRTCETKLNNNLRSKPNGAVFITFYFTACHHKDDK